MYNYLKGFDLKLDFKSVLRYLHIFEWNMRW